MRRPTHFAGRKKERPGESLELHSRHGEEFTRNDFPGVVYPSSRRSRRSPTAAEILSEERPPSPVCASSLLSPLSRRRVARSRCPRRFCGLATPRESRGNAPERDKIAARSQLPLLSLARKRKRGKRDGRNSLKRSECNSAVITAEKLKKKKRKRMVVATLGKRQRGERKISRLAGRKGVS